VPSDYEALPKNNYLIYGFNETDMCHGLMGL
jgi:hypothetical protein